MTPPALRSLDPQVPPSTWAGEIRYVARQPILNLKGHVHGYELIFRNPPEAVCCPGDDTAARTMLDNAVIFGLEGLTNGLPAFIGCTVESLTENLVLVLEPQDTVLAIPADLDPTPKILECCRKLKSRGFRLALDDFTWKPELKPLARMADYIRIGFDRFGQEERQYLEKLNPPGLPNPAAVARNVETQTDYECARAAGFTFFQGEYFCHPILLKKRKLPANRMLHFEIVQQLYHDPIDVRQVSRLVSRDAALTYRLLRLVNSPIYAIQQEVRSIDHAIWAMGEDNLRRIVSLAVLSELNDENPPEILQMALLRARFCQKSAGLCGQDPEEQYLLGMMSLVGAMLRMPMEELIPTLPLRAEICEALQGALNPQRGLLTWLECHERGDWRGSDEVAQAYQLWPAELMQNYAASAVWASASLRPTPQSKPPVRRP